MALSISGFCLVLGCLTLSLFRTSRGGNIGKKENQRCGNENFYCPMKSMKEKCIDRKLRCTASTAFTSMRSRMKCYKTSTADTYNYFKKTSPLPLTSWLFSKRKRRGSELKHWFVENRGFAYEFAPTVFQELDVNDPKYKYGK